MKVINSQSGTYTLNFNKGEEVISGIGQFLASKAIRAAHLTGLGAASKLVLAYYNLETKQYEKKEFHENVEILSLVGNVGVKDAGELVVHAHGVFGKKDFSTFGGHIFELVISGAGEIHLETFHGAINRAFDEETGLTLMCPEL